MHSRHAVYQLSAAGITTHVLRIREQTPAVARAATR